MTAKMLEDRRDASVDDACSACSTTTFIALVREHFRPPDLTRYRRDLGIIVDRPRARFAAWYEIFPRSSTSPGASGAPRHVRRRSGATCRGLPSSASTSCICRRSIRSAARSGRERTIRSRLSPDDVGSPWAIGNEHGGHTAIEPALGTLDDFDRFVETAQAISGMEIALDYALQCSPDHPWVQEHPDWFHIRPDGTIKYAENPPKKYQDIYPLNFWCDDRENLWNACRDVLLFWIEHGVKMFRVDNPHTKPFAFWEWMIRDIQTRAPRRDLLRRSVHAPEADEEPRQARLHDVVHLLHVEEQRVGAPRVLRGAHADVRRSSTSAATSSRTRRTSCNEYLVNGGRPAFRVRLLLAARFFRCTGSTAASSCVRTCRSRQGSEEYLDSEKYQLRPRNYDAPGTSTPTFNGSTRLRREHAALQHYANLTFHTSENPEHSVLPQVGARASDPVAGRGRCSPSRRPFKESRHASAFSRATFSSS